MWVQSNKKMYSQSTYWINTYGNCDKCDFKATQKGDLNQHIESKHEGVYYRCYQCVYKSCWKGELNKHVKSKHEGVHLKCSNYMKKGIFFI